MKTTQPDRNQLEERLRQEGRLPPGQTLVVKFPVLHFGSVPGFNPDTWRFRAWGEVESPLELDWEEFNRLPRTEIVLDLHCVTRWSLPDTRWAGVSLSTLVEMGLILPRADAQHVLQHAEGGFTANLPLEIMMQENFLLATHYNGAPITPDHGYPLRGVIGAMAGRKDLKDVYLWKGAKWLRGLEFLNEDQLGFWEQAGYHNSADIWREERYSYDR
jgi:DMSO/TMAO reductase YedYZ molybdopterin-dependent catalytic subunit